MPLTIDRNFITRWAAEYDRKQPKADRETEQELLTYAARLPAWKNFKRDVLLKLFGWKVGKRWEKHLFGGATTNSQYLISAVLDIVGSLPERKRRRALMLLDNVNTAVASTVLYFLEPHRFPIFDVNARQALRDAGLWTRRIDDTSDNAWWEYVQIVRELSASFDFPLRAVEKALFMSRGRQCP